MIVVRQSSRTLIKLSSQSDLAIIKNITYGTKIESK